MTYYSLTSPWLTVCRSLPVILLSESVVLLIPVKNGPESVSKAFCPHSNAKPAFQTVFESSLFEKLRFREGLVWTVVLTVEIKLRFQISPA